MRMPGGVCHGLILGFPDLRCLCCCCPECGSNLDQRTTILHGSDDLSGVFADQCHQLRDGNSFQPGSV
jgi:hypothetical protein